MENALRSLDKHSRQLDFNEPTWVTIVTGEPAQKSTETLSALQPLLRLYAAIESPNDSYGRGDTPVEIKLLPNGSIKVIESDRSRQDLTEARFTQRYHSVKICNQLRRLGASHPEDTRRPRVLERLPNWMWEIVQRIDNERFGLNRQAPPLDGLKPVLTTEREWRKFIYISAHQLELPFDFPETPGLPEYTQPPLLLDD